MLNKLEKMTRKLFCLCFASTFVSFALGFILIDQIASLYFAELNPLPRFLLNFSLTSALSVGIMEVIFGRIIDPIATEIVEMEELLEKESKT